MDDQVKTALERLDAALSRVESALDPALAERARPADDGVDRAGIAARIDDIIHRLESVLEKSA